MLEFYVAGFFTKFLQRFSWSFFEMFNKASRKLSAVIDERRMKIYFQAFHVAHLTT